MPPALVAFAIFMATPPAGFCIIRVAHFLKSLRSNHLGVSPCCFLSPKPPFFRFCAQKDPRSNPQVSLYSQRPRAETPCFPVPILQHRFATSGVNYAKAQLRDAHCKNSPAANPPCKTPTLCASKLRVFLFQIQNRQSKIANPHRHPGAQINKSSPQPLSHNSQSGGGEVEAIPVYPLPGFRS